MDAQVTAGMMVCAIPKLAVIDWLMKRLAELRQRLVKVAAELLKPDRGPSDAHQFECRVEGLVREPCRCIDVIPESTGVRIGPEKLQSPERPLNIRFSTVC